MPSNRPVAASGAAAPIAHATEPRDPANRVPKASGGRQWWSRWQAPPGPPVAGGAMSRVVVRILRIVFQKS